MPIGRCQLCLEVDIELLSSHYMPAGFHRIVQDGGPHATQIVGKVALLSSRQQQAYLLCQNCETRFQQRGEDWVISEQMLDRAIDAINRRITLVRTYDVPYLAGYSLDGKTIYIPGLGSA